MKKLLTSIAITSLMAGGLFAQSYKNQQQRIAQGVKSGQLTAGETSNLESKESAINGEARADRNHDGGKLTAAQAARINGQRQNLSGQIYKDKHNAAQASYGNNKVGQRRENQQNRIANGIASGKLNAGQTARLENREAGLNQQIRADRTANGGPLTKGERSNINKQQNQISKSIYQAKH